MLVVYVEVDGSNGHVHVVYLLLVALAVLAWIDSVQHLHLSLKVRSTFVVELLHFGTHRVSKLLHHLPNGKLKLTEHRVYIPLVVLIYAEGADGPALRVELVLFPRLHIETGNAKSATIQVELVL